MHQREEEELLLADDIELLSAEEHEGHATRSNNQWNTNEEEKATRSSPKSPPKTIPWRSLPHKRQLLILGLCRLSEPLSNTCLLPYIFYLMRSIVAPDTETPDEEQSKRIAKLSGVLIAIFPLMQLVTSMLWAKLADTHGRRPVIVWALLVSTISNFGFGFSRSFWGLMFWRSLSGIVNGNVGVMRTMTAEIVKERKFQTKAFLLLPLIFNSGMVIGLAVGGWFADPVHSIAWLFGPQGLLNFSNNPKGASLAVAFPFALPAMFNVACLSASLLLSFCGLRETLDGREEDFDVGLRIGVLIKSWLNARIPPQLSSYMAVTTNGDTEHFAPSADPPSSHTRSSEKPSDPSRQQGSIWTRDVLCALVSFGMLPLHNGAFMHIYPVFLSGLPTHQDDQRSVFHFKGGMGMHSRAIGLNLSLFGLCGIMLQLFIYPRLQARLGTLGVFRISLILFPLVYLFAPFLVLLPETGVMRWVCIALVTWGQIMARTLAIPSTVILVTHSAPAKGALGRIHGAGNMAASAARAVGPSLGGWVFAKGIEHDMVGMVWWFYLLVVAATALAWSFTMRRLNEI
jgi:MFS family permease